MIALLAATLLVPLVDQGVKGVVLARVGRGTVPLGALGELRVVRARIWAVRASARVSTRSMWIAWGVAGVVCAVVAAAIPGLGWALGLALGGALSHALETSLRGSVCDYVCLRFWPPFDLADVALALGALGLALELTAVLT